MKKALPVTSVFPNLRDSAQVLTGAMPAVTLPRMKLLRAAGPTPFPSAPTPHARQFPGKLTFLAVFFLTAVAALTAAPSGKAPLAFSPESWKFGMIVQGEKITKTVTVTNLSESAIKVAFEPTCDCMSVNTPERVVPPGASADFSISYDSSDDVGVMRKDFLVRTDPPFAPAYYSILGTVRAEKAAPKAGEISASGNPLVSGKPVAGRSDYTAASSTVAATYYYSPGCRSCEDFLANVVPAVAKKLKVAIDLTKRDILDPAAYEELTASASSLGMKIDSVPVLLIGGTLIEGDAEIRSRFESAVGAASGAAASIGAAQPRPNLPANAEAGSKASWVFSPPAPGLAATSAGITLSAFPVIAAGLIDGINPCAFTTLIFLLASLALAGRGRGEVLAIGALFSLAVFLTYLGIGLGFFAALRVASVVPMVSLILRWALVLALLVFAGLSVYDFALIRAGKPSEILLQLPMALKKRIHASIRTRVRTAALAGSSLVLGFLVSIFEFACTGQVYLPTLAYLVRVQRQTEAIGLLVVYNLCFIAPLLAVFAASYLGVSSQKITSAFQAHMGAVKLALAVVFAGLAVFTIVG